MLVTFTDNLNCIIVREPGDRAFRNESDLFYKLKTKLNAAGHDLVKKIMEKDGHMVGGQYGPYYLRDRKGRYCIWDTEYALRDLAKRLNEDRRVAICCTTLDGKKVDIAPLLCTA